MMRRLRKRVFLLAIIAFAMQCDHSNGAGDPCKPKDSPHNLERESCICCHFPPIPKQLPGRTSETDLNSPHPPAAGDKTCNPCHPDISPIHYMGQNPYLDPAVQENITDGASKKHIILCTDCHTPHGEDGNVFMLSDQYFSLCQQSRSINPHWRELMCNSCHVDRFPAGARTDLLHNGDVNAICNRCHHSEFARREIHPVGISPSKNIKIPAEMVLRDGKLTCSTCHHCALQKFALTDNPVKRLNRNFLRHASLSRVQYCFLCHISESYRRLNPHRQLDENGKIREATCLFCHASRPDSELTLPDSVQFIITNPVQYCIGCHPGFEHKHPSGGEHLVKPSAKIMRSLSTSVARIGVALPLFKGKIVCTTCHNPHEHGVIKEPAAAEGAQHLHKLRLVPGKNQCTGCHWDK